MNDFQRMSERIETLEAVLAYANSRADLAEKDALRYQHLKANALINWEPSDGIAMVIPEPDTGRNWKKDTDAAIDAQIAARKE